MNTIARKVRIALVATTLVASAGLGMLGSQTAQAGISFNLTKACTDQGGVVTSAPSEHSVPVSDSQFCDFSARAAQCPSSSRFDLVLKNCVVDHPEADASNDDACWLPSIALGNQHAPQLCPKGSENIGGLCYAACNTGFNPVGPVCWSGASSKPRAQKGPAKCGARETLIDGLCYENVGRSLSTCPNNFHLAGPVCYADCPSEFPVQCGAACAASGSDCAETLKNQITAPIELLANVVGTILSAGGGSPELVQSAVATAEAYSLNACPIEY